MIPGQAGLDGLEGVLANLDRVVKKMEGEAARKALDEQGDRLVEDVVANTPVLSGAAAGSVRKGAATPTEVVVTAGGSDAIYFPLIEFGGTHNQSPTAPFRRAMEKRRPVMLEETKQSYRRSVPELKE